MIKLPSQTDQNVEKISPPVEPPKESGEEEEEEEEDDWDTFQSFPASGNEIDPPPDRPPSISGHSSGEESDHNAHSASPSPSNKQYLNIEDHEFDEAANTHFASPSPSKKQSLNVEDHEVDDAASASDAVYGSDHQNSDEIIPYIQPNHVGEEHIDRSLENLEKTELGVSSENNQCVSDVQSDEHHMGASHEYERDLQPVELPLEPYTEHHLDTPSIVEQEIQAVSVNDPDVASVQDSDVDHHERTSNTIDDSENDDKKFPSS